jgi:DNA-binding transcriptional LysR family regulator
MNRLLEMEIFTTVADAGSISGAADRLDMAKSAVSKRLADLESRLGVSLMTRTTRRLSLTDAGADFYKNCTTILAEVAAAEAGVTEADAELSGPIRIAAPLSFGLQHLGPVLVKFMQQHPAINVTMDFNDRQIDLVAEGFDLGIRIAKLSDSTLVARKLTPVRVVVSASPAYWAANGRPKKPADLKNHKALRYTLAAQRNWTYVAPDGTRGSVTVPTQHAANNGAFLRAAAVAGLAIVRLPAFIVHEQIDSGELEPVLLDYCWNDIHAWAVYPQTRRLPARVRALIDYLAEVFGETPYWEACLSDGSIDA